MPGTPCPGQRWVLKAEPPPSKGPEMQSLFVPSTAPRFRAAYGQLCHFTGIQQENKVYKAKVIPELASHPVDRLLCSPCRGLWTPVLHSQRPEPAALQESAFRETGGDIQGSLCPMGQPSSYAINLFFSFFERSQDTRLEFLLLSSI